MALIIRIDVDRPYGREPLFRHVLSRVSSDAYFPRIDGFGYLKELNVMLQMLNEREARSYAFFRRCTLPSEETLKLLARGQHEIGLHLENSKTFETFAQEKQNLESHLGRKVTSFSKHGSGGARFGYHHYAPYEPEKYIEWAGRSAMKVFFGNQEDPTARPIANHDGLMTYPSAFWLEPHWRDTRRFTVDWLLNEAAQRDIVLLVHPENVLASPDLVKDFKTLAERLDTKILE